MAIKRMFCIVFLSVSVLLPPIYAQQESQINLPNGAIARIGKGKITTMQFLADGTQLAVGTDIGVWIYDVNTGDVKNILTPHPGGVDNIVLSPDRRILASSGCSSPVILLWDLETGKNIQTLPSHPNIDGVALTFSKDGKNLIGLHANWLEENTLIRWEIATGRRLLQKESTGVGGPLACARDNSTFAGVTRDGKITLLPLKSLEQEGFLTRKTKSVLQFLKQANKEKRRASHGIMTLTFSADGKTVATGGGKRIVRLWDTATHTERATLKGHNGWITAIAFTEDNSTLASGDIDKTIHLWDAHTGQLRTTLKAHTHTINTLVFAPDGKTLASGSLDGTIRLWNVNTGKELSIIATEHIMDTRAVAFSPDNKLCVTATFNGKIQTWDINTGDKLNSFTVAPIALTQAMALSSDASLFVNMSPTHAAIVSARNGYHVERRTAGWGNVNIIRLWNLNTRVEIDTLQVKFRPDTLTFTPNNRLIATTTAFSGIRLWEVSTGRETVSFPKVRDRMLAFSPDSMLLATGGNFNETLVWNANTGQKLATLAIGSAQSLAFSPDNTILAIGTHTEIHLWNLNTGRKPSTILTEHLIQLKWAKVNTLTFSPDSKTLLVGITGNRLVMNRNDTIYAVELWHLEKAERLATYPGHSDEIETLRFSHDGKTLASSSKDGTVLLWDWDKISSMNKIPE